MAKKQTNSLKPLPEPNETNSEGIASQCLHIDYLRNEILNHEKLPLVITKHIDGCNHCVHSVLSIVDGDHYLLARVEKSFGAPLDKLQKRWFGVDVNPIAEDDSAPTGLLSKLVSFFKKNYKLFLIIGYIALLVPTLQLLLYLFQN
ncbi:hypothetical protein [Leptospira kobayashii]|nr:hypothetical protein [Leptospira kobayashii]